MRIRISDSNRFLGPTYVESDAYRIFPAEFQKLFQVEGSLSDDQAFNDMYVNDTKFEEIIDYFLQSNSVAQFCIGYAGIGKTTCLRHCLDLGVKKVSSTSLRSKTDPQKHVLVFPTFLDGYTDEGKINDLVPQKVSAVCSMLENQFPCLSNLLQTPEGQKEFFDFICSYTPDILEDISRDWNDPVGNELQEANRKLGFAQKNHCLKFFASKLKFYIYKTYDYFDRLVILLDDIEGLPDQDQCTIILQYLHLFECMQNTQSPGMGSYNVNLIVSLRPHTYRIVCTDTRVHRKMQTYCINSPFLKKHAVPLGKLFERRFLYYSFKLGKDPKGESMWTESYRALQKLSEELNGKYNDMICNLCFENIREALALYARVMSNRFWIQGNREKRPYFKLRPSEFTFNNLTVLRAIGCGDQPIFSPSSNSVIPNFFYTTPKSDYIIYSLLVIQFFLKVKEETLDDEELYGINACKLSEVKKQWEGAIGKDKTQNLWKAMIRLFTQKILRKSIYDKDNYEKLDTPESLTQETMLYLSPKGFELIQMLELDSVLLEMLREDVYREYKSREGQYAEKGRYELFLEGNLEKLYIDLLEYIDALREEEETLFFRLPHSRRELYRSTFGEDLVVRRLFRGVERSLNYEGMREEVANKFYRIKRRLDESRKILMS